MIIGIHGLAQSGKSTAATALSTKLNIATFALAECVTNLCALMLDITHEEFLRKEKHQKITVSGTQWRHVTPEHTTVRKLMQNAGRELRKKDLYQIIRHTEAKIAQHPFIANYIISDIRLEHEAHWLREKGGVILHIIGGRSTNQDKDITEVPLAFQPALGDLKIKNHGTLEQYHDKISALIPELKKQPIEIAA